MSQHSIADASLSLSRTYSPVMSKITIFGKSCSTQNAVSYPSGPSPWLVSAYTTRKASSMIQFFLWAIPRDVQIFRIFHYESHTFEIPRTVFSFTRATFVNRDNINIFFDMCFFLFRAEVLHNASGTATVKVTPKLSTPQRPLEGKKMLLPLKRFCFSELTTHTHTQTDGLET